MKHRGLKLLLGFVLVIVLVALFSIFRIRQETAAVKIEPLEISDIADGDYHGSYQVGPVIAETLTKVKAGRISQIELIAHQNGLGQAGEQVIDKVIDQQKINVDTISGATTSSKVILKSIEKGLKGE